MPRTRPRVGAIIVTHGLPTGLSDCITDILRDDSVTAILVVDNGDEPAAVTTVNELKELDHRVNCFTPGKNLGFAGGSNLGVALLPEVEFVCLVSPRLRLTIRLSELCLAARPEFGLWAGIVTASDTGTVTNVRAPVTIRGEVVGAFLGHHHGCAAPCPSSGEPVRVSRLSGELLCVRRSTFESLGGLDESIEHHYADADLCDRAQRKGGVWLIPIEAGQLPRRCRDGVECAQRHQARAVSRVRYLRKLQGECATTSATACLLAILEAVSRLAEPNVDWRASVGILKVELAEIRHPDSQWVLRRPRGRAANRL